MDTNLNGKIITFYSFKGGTGRSMALANVAWILAMNGKRVLAIDWDLEAPGLHRYFEPFLADKGLAESNGIIDFVLEFAAAAISHASADNDPSDWYLPYANLPSYAVALNWSFPNGGLIDFVPAGRQDSGYAARVNMFDWQQFYQRLGGGVLLEQVKKTLRMGYDYVLIDSRTGVSDTAGVCTVQMPDALVVCFTMNQQSICGSSMAALSASKQRVGPDGKSILQIWPVPMRIETTAEKERLETARALARARFSGLLTHLSPLEEDNYWSEIEVPYYPYYAFDEVLAVFGDASRQTNSLSEAMKRLTRFICGPDSSTTWFLDSTVREEGLAQFNQRSARERTTELMAMASEYERLRASLGAGNNRTHLMNSLLNRAQTIAGRVASGAVGEASFREGRDGARVIGLALARNDPQKTHIEMVLQAIGSSRSPFEQYHGLLLALQLIPSLDPTAAEQLRSTVETQVEKTIVRSDMSRYKLAQDILKGRPQRQYRESPNSTATRNMVINGTSYRLINCVTTASQVRYDDPSENHGPWVATRGHHNVIPDPNFWIGEGLVSNELYLHFVKADRYGIDLIGKFLTLDGKSTGPASWPDASGFPDGQGNHPVSGISYLEAQAFVRWCNEVALGSEWVWALPSEDAWELAARTESGLTYPWGDAFDAPKCNSAERGPGKTTPVDAYPSGASRIGCRDMAGNLWEFVEATDLRTSLCALRGGSYKNNRYELRSYLRLFGVPMFHRAPDFGFRLVQKLRDVVEPPPQTQRSR